MTPFTHFVRQWESHLQFSLKENPCWLRIPNHFPNRTCLAFAVASIQPPSHSHMLPHETAWGGACSRSERRTSVESNNGFTVNNFYRESHLLFRCQSNQTVITVWRRYKKTRSSCAEMQSSVQNPNFIQLAVSTIQLDCVRRLLIWALHLHCSVLLRTYIHTNMHIRFANVWQNRR